SNAVVSLGQVIDAQGKPFYGRAANEEYDKNAKKKVHVNLYQEQLPIYVNANGSIDTARTQVINLVLTSAHSLSNEVGRLLKEATKDISGFSSERDLVEKNPFFPYDQERKIVSEPAIFTTVRTYVYDHLEQKSKNLVDFCKVSLKAAYKGTYAGAAYLLGKPDARSNDTLFLTLVGGSAFRNNMDWIADAITDAESSLIIAENDIHVILIYRPESSKSPWRTPVTDLEFLQKVIGHADTINGTRYAQDPEFQEKLKEYLCDIYATGNVTPATMDYLNERLDPAVSSEPIDSAAEYKKKQEQQQAQQRLTDAINTATQALDALAKVLKQG
ncbi:MAG: hypothetical protein WCE21_05960, partial [Candidatus Babeliales bacterium]